MRSLLGMLLLLAIGYALSRNRRAIRLRVLVPALLLQVALGALVLYVDAGRSALAALANGVNRMLALGESGLQFMFGPLVGDGMARVFGGSGYVFAFRALPLIIFVTALIAVLYHLGLMRWIVNGTGFALEKLLGVSRIEACAAVTTIFLGQSELPAMLKPFAPRLSSAELFAVLCSGMASTAGSVLAAYAGLGVRMDYLLAASVMAIPGGLLFAKLLFPGAGTPDLRLDIRSIEGQRAHNVIEAAATGAALGLRVAVSVGAMLIAFIGLIALLDAGVGIVAGLFGHPELGLQNLLGPLLAPLAWLIGVPWVDASLAGHWIAEKIILNEIVAYVDFSPYLKSPAELAAAGLPQLQASTEAIISFALCGFANLGSIAVLTGSFAAVCPQRQAEVAALGLRVVAAGTLSNLMSAAIAGLFFTLH